MVKQEKKNINKKFPIQENYEQLYGYMLRDKFSEICRQNLMRDVLNKTKDDNMLLRSNTIEKGNINKNYSIYNGYRKIVLSIDANMVGFKVGEFIFSRKIPRIETIDNAIRKVRKIIKEPKFIYKTDTVMLTKQEFEFINRKSGDK